MLIKEGNYIFKNDIENFLHEKIEENRKHGDISKISAFREVLKYLETIKMNHKERINKIDEHFKNNLISAGFGKIKTVNEINNEINENLKEFKETCIFINRNNDKHVKLLCKIVKHDKNDKIVLKPIQVLYSNYININFNIFEINLKFFGQHENFYLKYDIDNDTKIIFNRNLNQKVFI